MDHILQPFFRDFKEIVDTLAVTGNLRRLHDVVDNFYTSILSANLESLTETHYIQIEEIAVNMWNLAVTRRIELSLSENLIAKLCHVACKLIHIYGIAFSSEEAIRRQILMNMKTGKEWLDAGNILMADAFFVTTISDLERLYVKLQEACCTEASSIMHKIIVEKGVFYVLCLQAESAVIQGNFQKASMCVLHCKEMLIRLPDMTGYLHTFCYNLGVDASKKQNKYIESSFWLRQSYDIGKMNKDSVQPEMLAKALRLLATVYFNCDDEEYFSKAIIAILLANKEHLDPAGLFLKMKILIKGKACNGELLEAVNEILHLAMPLEFCLNTTQILINNKSTESILKTSAISLGSFQKWLEILPLFEAKLSGTAGDALKSQKKSFGSLGWDLQTAGNRLTCLLRSKLDPLKEDSVGLCFLKIIYDCVKLAEDNRKTILFSIGLLSQKDQDPIVQEKITEIIIDHQTRRRLTRDLVNWLHSILWGKAARSFQAQNYSDALYWYSFSLKMCEHDRQNPHLIKLKRNIASCYINLKQLDKAKALVTEVERQEPTNVITQFYIFKIAVMEGDSDRALQMVVTIQKSLTNGELSDSDLFEGEVSRSSILCLAVQFAVENGQPHVAGQALEYLCQISKDPKEVLGALKCLVRIMFPDVSSMPESETKKKTLDKLLTYLNTAFLIFSQSFDEEPSNANSRVNDVNWFRKIAWNLALQSNKDRQLMKNFLMISYKLSLFCPCDQGLLIAQKTCLLVAAAVDLELGRKATTRCEQIRLLRTSLERIQKCKIVWNLLKQTGDFSGDDCETILLLYEFEVKTKTNDPSLYTFLETIWKMPNIDSRILEAMAVLAMDKPAHYPPIAQKALSKLLVIYKNKEPIDVLKYSECVHNLIELLMSDGLSSTVLYSLSEVWGYLKGALSLIRQMGGYPEQEILWLMVKSWNIGIMMYSRNKYVCAKRWVCLALDFLNHLGSLKVYYEAKVNHLYAILNEALEKKWALNSAEMAERVRALDALPEDPGSVPSAHTAAPNNL